VRRIVPLANGEVWVLFGERPWMGAVGEFPLYPRERHGPPGLARYVAGRWEFSVKLEGVPASRPIESRSRPIELPADRGAIRAGSGGPAAPGSPSSAGTPTPMEPLPILYLAGAGGKLFVANRLGVYAGPRPWKQVFSGAIVSMEASADRTTLEIVPETEENRHTTEGITFHRYDPAVGRLTTEKLPPNQEQWWSIHERGDVLHSGGAEPQFVRQWVRIPITKPGQWAIGPLPPARHKVVETSAAVWIASEGELIRVDRKRLADQPGR